MDGSGVYYEQLGYGATLVSRLWILRRAPILGGLENAQNRAENVTVPHLASSWPNGSTQGNRKINLQKSDDRATFWRKISKSPWPSFEILWWVHWTVTRPQSQFSSPLVTMGRDLYIEAHIFETGSAAVLKFCMLLDMTRSSKDTFPF